MQKIQLNPPAFRRDGVTLTEVLMSLMIMAIGATSVMTLFPIATLRSAAATKLTNATILKQDIEEILAARPELIFDPDGDGNYNEHFRRVQDRTYIVDPIGYYSMLEYATDNSVNSPFDIADHFGHFPNNAPSSIPRFDGRVNAQLQVNAPVSNDEARALRISAQSLAALGDSWDTIYEFFPTTPVYGAGGSNFVAGVQIPADIIPDAATLAILPTSANNTPPVPNMVDPESTRIIVFTADGEFSQSFPLLAVDESLRAIWSEAFLNSDFNGDGHVESRTLPREFRNASGVYTAGRVLIQTRRSVDYSWLLSVRRTADGRVRSMDVIVRFGKEPAFEDERLYPVTVPAGTPVSKIIVEGGGASPAIRKGGFVFDVGTGRWHRIRDDDEGANNVFQIELEKPASSFEGPVLFIPGIVDVYGMGSRSIPSKLLRGF